MSRVHFFRTAKVIYLWLLLSIPILAFPQQVLDRVQYEYEYEKWTPARPVEPFPTTDKRSHDYFIRRGNTEEEIARADQARQIALQNFFKEKTEIGRLLVRRYKTVVLMEKTAIKHRSPKEDWIDIATEKAAFERATNLKGIINSGVPPTSTYRDYSNGDLLASHGPFGVNNKTAGEISRESRYSFPSTVGNGVLALPLAGLSSDYFCTMHAKQENSSGKIEFEQDIERNGHKVHQKFDFDSRDMSFLRYSEINAGKEYYRVEVLGSKFLDGQKYPLDVEVTLTNIKTGEVIERTKYRLKKITAGDKVEIGDLTSLGPKGEPVTDNRFKTSHPVHYEIGDKVKSDTEVRRLANAATQTSNAFTKDIGRNFVFIGVGIAALAALIVWISRGRK